MQYKEAGVDIDKNAAIKKEILGELRSARTPEAIGKIGLFGALFDASAMKGMRSPVLVASTDGVGTKLKVAAMEGRWDTVGIDLVNHCVNDILVQGARPLFFMDYVAAQRLEPEIALGIVRGVARACRENGMALLGGETAEMPGIYEKGEYDLAGTIVGVVEKDDIIDGSAIAVGDAIIGVRSSGLHTNGYSLARSVLFEKAGMRPSDVPEGWTQSIVDALLAPHVSYAPAILPWVGKEVIKGMAHITGGGFPENISRILPDGCAARIDLASWEPQAIFKLIQDKGGIGRDEMYRAFNMGIGLVMVVAEENTMSIQKSIPGSVRIGSIVAGDGVSYV